MANFDIGARSFHWAEVSHGKNRSLGISETGVPNSLVEFEIKYVGNGRETNVHNLPAYNTARTRGPIYNALAVATAEYRIANDEWPDPGFLVQIKRDQFVLR